VNVLGTPMVFVNSYEAAWEIFERRSSVYADRPDLPMMMLSVRYVLFSETESSCIVSGRVGTTISHL
jgi:hypothetical protein